LQVWQIRYGKSEEERLYRRTDDTVTALFQAVGQLIQSSSWCRVLLIIYEDYSTTLLPCQFAAKLEPLPETFCYPFRS
jgi:hypothetical protein